MTCLAARWPVLLPALRRPGHHLDRGALDEHGGVWSIPTRPGDGTHPAVMPIELARRAVLAGCPDGGMVLEPFAGAATTGVAALGTRRRFVGVELHTGYARAAAERLGLAAATGQ